MAPVFVAGTFVPSIPQIARDLNTTGTVVGCVLSLVDVFSGVGMSADVFLLGTSQFRCQPLGSGNCCRLSIWRDILVLLYAYCKHGSRSILTISDGRRPVYLAATPLLFLGSVGVATARTVPQLLIWRFLQTCGASPGFSVGAGVIGDIYKLEERGAAMGMYFAVRIDHGF